MPKTIDLQAIQEVSSDPVLLDSYLQQLIGQPFLAFRFSYGDELALHFGAPGEYSSPKLRHLRKGSFILGTRASRWYLVSTEPPTLVIGSSSDDDVFWSEMRGDFKKDKTIPANHAPEWMPTYQLEKVRILEPGIRVVVVETFPLRRPEEQSCRYGIGMTFSNGTRIVVIPDERVAGDAGDENIADWELFTPFDRLLKVGPRDKWAYLPSRGK